MHSCGPVEDNTEAAATAAAAAVADAVLLCVVFYTAGTDEARSGQLDKGCETDQPSLEARAASRKKQPPLPIVAVRTAYWRGAARHSEQCWDLHTYLANALQKA